MRTHLYYIIRRMASFSAILFFSLLIYITSTAPLKAGEIRLPSLGGDYSASIMSPEQERLLGESFMRSLRDNITIYNELSVQHYIQTLGERLATQSDITAKNFEFFVVDNPTINAFAGPDGKIGIHTGLIKKTESEGELAAVLAHEIAHVSQRHLMRRLESQQNLSIPTIATVLATIVATSADSDAGHAVIATATGLSLQKQINFTRSNEQEADRIGMQILYDAGYDPINIPRFFRRLQEANRYSGDGVPEYLRTHPLTLSRIADAESRAVQFTRLQNSDRDEFHQVRQILLVNSFNNPQLGIRHYRSHLQNMSDEQTDTYLQFGYGLALIRADLPKQALKQLLPLLSQNPEQPNVAISVSKAYTGAGAIDNALKVTQQLHNLYPSHLPLTLHYADLLMQNGQPKESVRLLEHNITDLHGTNSKLYKTLATAYAVDNQIAKSHIAQAQYLFLMTETDSALKQLDYAERAAKNNGGDFIIFSTIDAHRHRYEEKRVREQEHKF